MEMMPGVIPKGQKSEVFKLLIGRNISLRPVKVSAV